MESHIERLSNCCWEIVLENTDICSKCLEHSRPYRVSTTMGVMVHAEVAIPSPTSKEMVDKMSNEIKEMIERSKAMRIDDFNGVLLDRFAILDYLDELGLIRKSVDDLKMLTRVVDAIKLVLPEDIRVVSIPLVGDFIIKGNDDVQPLFLVNEIIYRKAIAEIGCRYINASYITSETNTIMNRSLVDAILGISSTSKEDFISYINGNTVRSV